MNHLFRKSENQREQDVPTSQSIGENNPFKPDFGLIGFVFVGVVGFLIGCIVIFQKDLQTNKSEQSGTVFHEIQFDAGEILLSLLPGKITEYENAEKPFRAEVKAIDTIVNNKDSLTKAKTSKDVINSLLLKRQGIAKNLDSCERRRSSLQKMVEAAKNARTDLKKQEAISQSVRLQLELPKVYSFFGKSFADFRSQLNDVPVVIRDTTNKVEIKETVPLKVVPYSSDLAFLDKYPQAGIWVLLLMAFYSLCGIVIMACIRTSSKVVNAFDPGQIPKNSGLTYFLLCGFILLIFVVLVSVWSKTFYDDTVIKEIYFMADLTKVIEATNVVGYLAGAFCLGGFLYTAGMLGVFSKTVKRRADEQKEYKRALENIQALNKGKEPVAKNVPTEDDDAAKKDLAIFNNLRGHFETYFLFTATIFTLMVMCTGSLFEFVNSLDFIKAMTISLGYSPARTDFVYLYGGLHTIVLLLVYLPARLRCNEVRLNMDKDKEASDDKDWQGLLKGPLTEVKALFVASSPFLVSLMQALMSAFFQ